MKNNDDSCSQMDTNSLKKEDIQRMWSQIVTQTGIDKYTYAKWQEYYEDYWKCMLSNSEPYIRIQSVEELTGTSDKHSSKVKHKKFPDKPVSAKKQSIAPGTMSMLRIPRLKPEDELTKSVTESLGPVESIEPQLQQVLSEEYTQAEQSTQQIDQGIDKAALSLENQELGAQLERALWGEDQEEEEENEEEEEEDEDEEEEEDKEEEEEEGAPQQLFKGELQQQYPLPPKLQDQQMGTLQRPYDSLKSNQLIMNNRGKLQSHEGDQHDATPKASELQRKTLFKPSKSQDYSPNQKANNSKKKPKSGSDCELENKLIADALVLANKVRKADKIGKDFKKSPEIPSNDAEKIDHWLQNFDEKAPRAIEHDIADTSEFFKNLPHVSAVMGKTSHELKATLHNVIICEDMEEGRRRQKE